MFDNIFGDEISSKPIPRAERLQEEGIEIGFLTSEIFQDPDFQTNFLNKLPPEEQYQYLKNTSLFEKKLSKDRWAKAGGESGTIFGDETIAPSVPKADGTIRPEEKGYSINLEVARQSGIDTSKVLVFRATQPSETDKPELYWTTDYYEKKRTHCRDGCQQRHCNNTGIYS